MNYYLSHIKDSIGNNYLGIKFHKEFVSPYLEYLREIIDDEDKFETLTNNQFRRDSRDGNPQWHCTVINVMEYNLAMKKLGLQLFTDKLNAAFNMIIDDLEVLGVGKAERNENEAYFAVLNSEQLQEVRKAFGFNEKDLHITLGFDQKDVFGVSKGKDSIIKKKAKLRKVLDQLWKVNKDWTFLFDIGNFPDVLKKEDAIEPISLSDSVLTIKIDHTQLQISLIEKSEGEELWVVTQSEWEEK